MTRGVIRKDVPPDVDEPRLFADERRRRILELVNARGRSSSRRTRASANGLLNWARTLAAALGDRTSNS